MYQDFWLGQIPAIGLGLAHPDLAAQLMVFLSLSFAEPALSWARWAVPRREAAGALVLGWLVDPVAVLWENPLQSCEISMASFDPAVAVSLADFVLCPKLICPAGSQENWH